MSRIIEYLMYSQEEKLDNQFDLLRGLASRINAFIYAEKKDTNIFSLLGEIPDHAIPTTAVGLFANRYPRPEGIGILTSNTRSLTEIYGEILGLVVQEDLREGEGGGNDPVIRRLSKIHMLVDKLPYITIMMGEVPGEPDKKVALLYAIKGFSPRAALAEVQEAVRKDRLRLN